MALASRLLRRNSLNSSRHQYPPSLTLTAIYTTLKWWSSMTQATTTLAANGHGNHAKPSPTTTFVSKFVSPTFKLPYPDHPSSTPIPSFNDLTNWPTDPMQVFCQWYQDAERDYLQRTNNMSEPHIEISLPNQIQIATVDRQRMVPQLRTVLLKGIDSRGLIFFTNYNGAKGKQLQAHPYAAVNLYIKSLERQIRVEGSIEYLSGVESDLYFHERPIPSQVGAAVSKQSTVIPNRDDLEERYLQTVHRIADQIKQHTQQHQQNGSASLAQSQQQNSTLDQQQQKRSDSTTPTASELTGPRYQQALDTLKQYESSDLKDELCGLVQRPTNWGGFLLRPTRFEYWCDGKYRLHSRIQYTSSEYESVCKGVKPLQQPTAEDSIAHQRNVNSEEVQQELRKAVSRGPMTSDQQWERVFLSP